MKVLIADDDPISSIALRGLLTRWGHEVVSCEDGEAAWELLRADGGPSLAILDWMMPKLDGVRLCQRLRETPREEYTYLILLTARDRPEDIAAGLGAGADDYITKPFQAPELHARLQVGERIVTLLSHVKLLQGLLPICMYCHKVRNDKEAWQRIDHYIEQHTGAVFSHGICQECFEREAWR